jgi:hypothetical protein
MGKCETATAAIGISILLSDIILQINEKNFDLIKEILTDGCIEDGNDYYNEAYDNIINCEKFKGNYIDVKEYLIEEFKNTGSHEDYLFDKALLVPIKEILMNDRWGYDRYGTNCVSRLIDFDLSINVEKYQDIKNFKIVFLLSQHTF